MKRAVFIIVFLGQAGAAFFYLYNRNGSPNVEAFKSTVNDIIVQSDTNAEDTLTINEVKKHNSLASCWTIINGIVYDLTEYAPKHKGGSEKIALICGKDGTSAFEGAHGGNEKPMFLLNAMKLGVLAD